MTTTDRDLRAEAEAWIADDPDPATRAELQAVLDGLPGTTADLADRFAESKIIYEEMARSFKVTPGQ